MKIRHTGLAIAAACGLALLGACGQGSKDDNGGQPAADASEVILANGMTPKEQIETRQGHLKNYGKAFKTVSDQLKAGNPDVAAIQAAVASLQSESEGMETWFPEGTGPESGVKTDALLVIWETRADFDQKIANFHIAAGELAVAAEGGDIEAIRTAFGNTGGTCKSCHDTYRKDD